MKRLTVRHLAFVLSLLLFATLGVSAVTAQTTDVCSTIVTDAIQELGNNCGELGRNQICYGNFVVDRDFRDDQPINVFSRPSDISDIDMLARVQTGPFDEERNEWGIAAMSLQADVEDTLPGQSALFLLLGDANLEDNSASLEDYDPMRAFYFRGGIGTPDCAEAPSTLAIQSRGDLTLELNINGLDIRLGSIITLQNINSRTIVLTLHEGVLLTVDPAVILQEGESIEMKLDANGDYDSLSAPRPATMEELALAVPVTRALDALETSTTVEATDDTEEDATIVSGDSDEDNTYVVQPGDNMFRIALNNGTCVSELASVNNIPRSQVRSISAGITLTIPDGSTCGSFVNDVPLSGGTFTTATTTIATSSTSTDSNVTTTTEPDEFNCDALVPTSPLEGLPIDEVTFFWDGISTAQLYKVNLYKNGFSVVSTSTRTSTSVTADLRNIPNDFDDRYYWEVIAVQDGVEICRSRTGNMGRELG